MALAASNGPVALTAYELVARAQASAVALEALFQGSSPSTSAQRDQDGIRELAEQIRCCFDRALAVLHGDDTDGCPSKKRSRPPLGPGVIAQARPPKRRARGIGSEMPTRVAKMSTPDDGFLWRKYGQKVILNCKYPRTYFRCTYKHDKGCKATRQVQQSEDDPSVYVVTYFGEHTCGMDAVATAAVASGDNKKSPQLVINFGAGGATSSVGSPWLSSCCSEDDVGSNSSQFSRAVCLLEEEERGDQKENNNLCNNVDSSVMTPPAPEPSSTASVSCSPPDLDSLLRHFDWDDYWGDILFDMEFDH